MITNITKVIPITLVGSGCTTVGFLGRRVPDDACHHHVRDDRRLALGPASSVNAATNANHPVAPSFSCGPDLKTRPAGSRTLSELLSLPAVAGIRCSLIHLSGQEP